MSLVSATYKGDANTKPSTASLPLTVTKLAAGTYIASAPDASAFGGTVIMTVLLLGAAGSAPPLEA